MASPSNFPGMEKISVGVIDRLQVKNYIPYHEKLWVHVIDCGKSHTN